MVQKKQSCRTVFYEITKLLPHCQTNFQKFSIQFRSLKFFNSLSHGIQNSLSTSLFCKRL